MAEAGGHTELVQYLLAKGGKRNRQLPPIKKQDPPRCRFKLHLYPVYRNYIAAVADFTAALAAASQQKR